MSATVFHYTGMPWLSSTNQQCPGAERFCIVNCISIQTVIRALLDLATRNEVTATLITLQRAMYISRRVVTRPRFRLSRDTRGWWRLRGPRADRQVRGGMPGWHAAWRNWIKIMYTQRQQRAACMTGSWATYTNSA